MVDGGTPQPLAGSPWEIGLRELLLWWDCPAGSECPSSSCPELPENWTDTRETLLEGMLFSLKYLGMTLVEQPKGEEMSAAAIKRIVATVSPGDGEPEPGTAAFWGIACPMLITPIRCV